MRKKMGPRAACVRIPVLQVARVSDGRSLLAPAICVKKGQNKTSDYSNFDQVKLKNSATIIK